MKKRKNHFLLPMQEMGVDSSLLSKVSYFAEWSG
jgi:hypothetical protein